MARYSQGTIDITGTAVTGTGTGWTDSIVVADDTLVIYTTAGVQFIGVVAVSDTAITVASYIIARDSRSEQHAGFNSKASESLALYDVTAYNIGSGGAQFQFDTRADFAAARLSEPLLVDASRVSILLDERHDPPRPTMGDALSIENMPAE